MSDNGLGPEGMEVLRLLATWVTQVYLPMFYEIKVKHFIEHGAGHLIKLFRRWRQQDKTVNEVSQPYLISESWWAHPENVLVALLSSDYAKKFAVDKIVAARGESEQGSTAVRSFKVPKTVNVDAIDLTELIDGKQKLLRNLSPRQKCLWNKSKY